MTDKFNLDITFVWGKFSQILPLFHRSTIQHADEIQKSRITEIASSSQKELPLLRHNSFITADFAMYRIEKGKIMLYLARNPDHKIFDNIINSNKYSLIMNNEKDIQSVINSDAALRIPLGKLKLESTGGEHTIDWRVLKSNKILNKYERSIAERVGGNKTTDIYLLEQDYIRERMPKNGALAGLCQISSFPYKFWAGNYGGWDNEPIASLRGKLDSKKFERPKYNNIISLLNKHSIISYFSLHQSKMLESFFKENYYKIIKDDTNLEEILDKNKHIISYLQRK